MHLFLKTAFVAMALLLLAITACSAAQPQSPTETKTLRIGSVMPFTGAAAGWGVSTRPIMEVYAELINEDGGIKIGDDTYKIELSFLDDGYMPAPGAAAARQLIYDKKVTAIVGYFSMGFSAVAPVTNAEKVIFLARTGSGVVYDAAKDPYVIFGSPASEMVLYQQVAAFTAYPKIKVIAWTGPEAARFYAESAFEQVDKMMLEKFGLKSLRIYYPEGTTNFTPYITKMAEGNADFVCCGGSVLEVALMAKQRWASGYKWPVSQTGTLSDPATFINICGKDAAQGIVSERPAPWELKKTKVQQKYLDMTSRIMTRFQEKYGKPLVYVGSLGHGVAHIGMYLEAVQKAGTTDPDKVMSVFKNDTFETFIGRYKLTGEKTYGANVCFGSPCAVGIIDGDKEIYLGEYPLTDIDKWDSPLN